MGHIGIIGSQNASEKNVYNANHKPKTKPINTFKIKRRKLALSAVGYTSGS